MKKLCIFRGFTRDPDVSDNEGNYPKPASCLNCYVQKRPCEGVELVRPAKGKTGEEYLPKVSIRIKFMQYFMDKNMLTTAQRDAWFNELCKYTDLRPIHTKSDVTFRAFVAASAQGIEAQERRQAKGEGAAPTEEGASHYRSADRACSATRSLRSRRRR